MSLTKSDFNRWDTVLQADNELTRTARWQMDDFRQRDPELFYKLYPVAKDKRTAEDWFDACEGGLSHPYDPLLVLSAFQPKLFRRRGILGAGGGFDMNSAASTGDKRRKHAAIGNTNRCPGVKDAAKAHDALCALIQEGLEGCVESSRFPKMLNSRAQARCCCGLAPACSVHNLM